MKWSIVPICLLILFLLTGCCWQEWDLITANTPTENSEANDVEEWEKDMFGRFFSTDADKADEVLQSVVSAIEAQDALSLKALFSDYAIDASENIDEQINQLLSFYEGEMVSFLRYGPGSHSEKDVDKHVKEIFASYDVHTTEGDYRVAIKFCTIDSANPENIGIRSIYIIRSKSSNFAYWGGDEWNAGINIET